MRAGIRKFLVSKSQPVLVICLIDPESAGPDFNIPFAIKVAFKNTSSNLPDILVCTLPHIKIESSNLKDFDVSSDIPFRKADIGSGDTSLPWALTGNDFSVYILTTEVKNASLKTEMCYIWHPAQWTMFLAAAHANSKTPEDVKSPFPQFQDSLTMFGVMPALKRPTFDYSASTKEFQPSLGFCVHIDLTSVIIGVSRKQVISDSQYKSPDHLRPIMIVSYKHETAHVVH